MVTKLSGTTTWANRWEVDSHSSDKTYVVGQKADGSWGCACPRWIFAKQKPRPDCKHILEIKMEEPVDLKKTSKVAAEKYMTAVKVAKHMKTPMPVLDDEPVFLMQTRRKITIRE